MDIESQFHDIIAQWLPLEGVGGGGVAYRGGSSEGLAWDDPTGRSAQDRSCQHGEELEVPPTAG